MAKLGLLLVLVCVQLSRQEESAVEKPSEENLPGQSTLIGEWAEKSEEVNGSDQEEDEWTEEDEKWLEVIQQLLEGDDSDEEEEDDYSDEDWFWSKVDKWLSDHKNSKWSHETVKEFLSLFEESDEEYEDEDWFKESEEKELQFNNYPGYLTEGDAWPEYSKLLPEAPLKRFFSL